jgi:hypothetical protein
MCMNNNYQEILGFNEEYLTNYFRTWTVYVDTHDAESPTFLFSLPIEKESLGNGELPHP